MKYNAMIAAIAASTVSAAGTVYAADNRPMEHVLISVPIHKKQAETALPVTVLSGEELRRQAATTLGETLSQTPGVANASFGPGVGRPVIRGQQGPRAKMLQNGMLSADVSSLSPDHSVTVEALLAESIEVLRGPSTLLYGGGAIGGVVNVIDNRIPRAPLDGVEGAVEYRYDSAPDLNSGVARVEAGNGETVVHLSGTARQFGDLEIPGDPLLERDEEEMEDAAEERGKIGNSDGDAQVFNFGVSHHLGEEGFAGFAVSHLETEYGIPAGSHEHGHDEDHEDHHDDDHDDDHGDDHDEHDDDHDEHDEHAHGEEEEDENIRLDVEQTRYDAQVHLHDALPGVEVMRTFLTYTDYQHVELEGVEEGTRFDRETWEARVEMVHKPLFGAHGVIGLQWRDDSFAAAGEEAYVPKTLSDEVGIFIVEDFHAGDWTFEAGLRGDWVERDPDAERADSEEFFSVSASGAALWQISDSFTTGLSLSRSERAPATEELYSNTDAVDMESLVEHAATRSIEVGNTDLEEEVSLNADLTLNWRSDLSYASLTVFYNQFEDYIFLRNSGEEVDETPIYFYEQEDADFYGVELDSEFALVSGDSGSLLAGVSGDYVRGELDSAGDVPRLPPLRYGARIEWRADSWSAWVRWQEAEDQDDPGQFEDATEGYTRWDAGADWRFTLAGDYDVTLFAKWKNIGDEEIRLSTSFLRDVAPEAGMSVETGLRINF